jgi:ankyrin repeat protein
VAFKNILSAAEAGPWREEDVPAAERGVSLHWLVAFVLDRWESVNEPRRLAIEKGNEARAHNEAGKWGRHDMPDMEIPKVPPYYFLNTHGLKSEFVLPLTKDIRAPLFALVPPEHRGRPTAFISHTWNSLLIGPQRQRIGTLNALLEDKDQLVWIDFACYNQHTVEHRDISDDMLGIIKAINNVVVAVTPTPLYNRSWCLWELYCADTIGLTPTFRVCHGFRNDKIQAVNALYRSFSGVENARSINAQVEKEIRDAIIKQHGSTEKANVAIKAMLQRQLGSKWHELQPDDGPLKFSADPWADDQQGATLRAYEPYWEPGLLDSAVHGGTETVREVFAGAGVYVGAQEASALSVQKGKPASLRFIDALQNEDTDSIMRAISGDAVDVNQPLPFRSVLSYEVAPPLHFLMPWAQRKTIELLLLMGADPSEPWTYPPETKSTAAAQREQLVRALLSGAGDPGPASWTPLMLAVQRGDFDICLWLIEHGALIPWPKPAPPGIRRAFVSFSCPQTGLTALHVAAAMRRTNLVELLAPGASVDAQLANGLTALHIAAITGDVGSIALLLRCGAHKDVRDRAGQSALDWARRCKQTAAAELLGTPQ